MKEILFVSDDEYLLNGLRRSLRGQRSHWDMHFVATLGSARRLCRERELDAVISELRFADGDGVAFLEMVMELHPAAVRIALSGGSDSGLAMRAARCSHRFVSTPCDPSELQKALQRAFDLREQLGHSGLAERVAQLASLPAQPQLYQRVLAKIAEPGSSLTDVGNLLARDPAMSAKLLQLVNSAYFGLATEVRSVPQAVTLLGFDVLKSLVFSIELFRQYEGRNLALDLLWAHSLRCGSLAQRIARELALPRAAQDAALMAGLLHDVGKLVLATECPERFGEVLRLAAEEQEGCVLERELFGADHATIGACLLGLWGLPDPVVVAVAGHHTALSGEAKGSAAAVRIAELLLQAGDGAQLERLTAEAERLGLMPECIEDWYRTRDDISGGQHSHG